MKGKYINKKKKKSVSWLIPVIIILSVLLVGGILAVFLLDRNELPERPEQTIPTASETVDPVQEPENTETYPDAQIKEYDEIHLPSGMTITRVDSYAGVYMEDGSDDVVSGVMMIILENTTQQDLQLARIRLNYEQVTAEFEVTNLPAGAKVVLLEKNRLKMPEDMWVSATEENVVFFDEPMDTMEDTLEITTKNGVLTVTNITDEDITGDIYIYYKNSASDIMYGGITYRARVEGGLPAGLSGNVITGHFSDSGSVIVSVVVSQ